MTQILQDALDQATPGLSPQLKAAIAGRSSRIHCDDGAQLFGPGDSSDAFLIPLKGAVRVEHMGPTGRSVVLYRVAPGDSCVMTTSCLLSGAPYEAYGYAEGAVEAIAMPAAVFRDLIEQEPEFRTHALSVFSRRMIELVEVIDELLLHRVDLRLAGWLAEKAAAGVAVAATHQAIASELGTAREVVSRILKDFERRGWIGLTRGEIRLVDPAALRRFANAR
ncbi:MAG: Crp/Fnr family transcriptional regulator [Paracoccaceae bacterium]|nr:Crp/Fnr family transcriptional regulator [Paracoccaceae bacterium]